MRMFIMTLCCILLTSCSEKKMSETQKEYGYVTKLIYQPEEITISLRSGGNKVKVDSSGGVSVNDPFDYDPTDFGWADDDDIPVVRTHKTPARWGVEFSCEHGKQFTIWRDHEGLFKRFQEGNRVVIAYKAELENKGKKDKEHWVETGEYDFLDAQVYIPK